MSITQSESQNLSIRIRLFLLVLLLAAVAGITTGYKFESRNYSFEESEAFRSYIAATASLKIGKIGVGGGWADWQVSKLEYLSYLHKNYPSFYAEFGEKTRRIFVWPHPFFGIFAGLAMLAGIAKLRARGVK